jgi:hypothetical protein
MAFQAPATPTSTTVTPRKRTLYQGRPVFGNLGRGTVVVVVGGAVVVVVT